MDNIQSHLKVPFKFVTFSTQYDAERCKLPNRGPGRSSDNQAIWWHLESTDSVPGIQESCGSEVTLHLSGFGNVCIVFVDLWSFSFHGAMAGLALPLVSAIDCHLIISCFIKIQTGLTFLVPAYLGCPGKEAVKQVFTTQQSFYGPLSGTTQVSWYQKKHSPTHHPDNHPIFISFFHLPRSIASSLFTPRAWQSFCSTSLTIIIITNNYQA